MECSPVGQVNYIKLHDLIKRSIVLVGDKAPATLLPIMQTLIIKKLKLMLKP